MDGTLVDSGALHFDAWRATMRVLGGTLTRAEFDATFGQRNDAILRRLVDPQISDAEIARIGDDKEARYRALVAARGSSRCRACANGCAPRRAGWRQAIASSGPRANAQAILARSTLAAAFAAIVSAEDVVRGKPDPEVFLAAAQRSASPLRLRRRRGRADGDRGRPPRRHAHDRRPVDAALDADRVVAALTDLEADAFERMIASAD